MSSLRAWQEKSAKAAVAKADGNRAGDQTGTVERGEVGLGVPPGLVGQLLRDGHVSLHLLLHLHQRGVEVHLPVLSVQARHELLQLRLGAVVPDLFLLMVAVLLAVGREDRNKTQKLAS